MKNKYEIRDDIAVIYCNHKGSNVSVLIDADDFLTVSSVPGAWVLKTDRTSRATQYCTTKIDGKNIYMHRFILEVTDPDVVVDHKDGNGLNNTRGNIKATTRSKNGRNRHGNRSDNKSGYAGVAYQTKAKKWKATIAYKGKQMYLGIFDNVEDAISARKKAERKYWGLIK